MYETIELKQHPEVKRVVVAGFPSYKKMKAVVCDFPSHGLNINSYWSGGSRDEYAIVDLITGQRKSLPTRTHPFYEVANKGLTNTEDSFVSVDHVGNVTLKVLPERFAIIQAGTFCGKPATARVYVNSANLTRLLPCTTASQLTA